MSRLTINSNIPSLNAQRNLGNASKSLETSFTRLSSGLRINKASDDAAGLSISESLKADTRIFNQGVRNLNDGASLLNIAEGALGELSNITIRLRELATQSANGTLGNKQRIALDQEAQSLSKEYNRIARSTEFNGRKIFNGDFGNLSLAAGGGSESLIVSGLGGAIGDGSFVSRRSYVTGVNPTGVTVGDFNGDGISDLVSADNIGESISVFLGNSNGTFSSRRSLMMVNTADPFSVAVGDFNGDGFSDLVSANESGDSYVFLGNGDGTFSTSHSFSMGSQPRSVKVSDFNGDDISDLVSTDRTGNTLSVYLGNRNGSFSAGQSYSTGLTPSSVAIGDFNGDGISDLVTADYFSTRVSVFLGNGNGSFSARLSFVTGLNPVSVSVGDFNGDSILDLVSTDESSSRVSVFLGNGNGSFSSRLSFVTGAAPSSVVVSDFNGDGISDLASADYNENNISVFLGNGNGSFFARRSLLTGNSPISVVVGDFNGDGVSDLVSADYSSSRLGVFLGNSNSGVSALQSFSLKTKSDAKEAMTYLSGALTRISNQRGQIGAFQSRVEVATSNLQTTALNYSDANSRISDIDVAEESSRLTATKILQQSATSVLAQANQQPRLVLKLLSDI